MLFEYAASGDALSKRRWHQVFARLPRLLGYGLFFVSNWLCFLFLIRLFSDEVMHQGSALTLGLLVLIPLLIWMLMAGFVCWLLAVMLQGLFYFWRRYELLRLMKQDYLLDYVSDTALRCPKTGLLVFIGLDLQHQKLLLDTATAIRIIDFAVIQRVECQPEKRFLTPIPQSEVSLSNTGHLITLRMQAPEQGQYVYRLMCNTPAKQLVVMLAAHFELVINN